MTESIKFSLGFGDATPAQANQWAGDLKQFLEDTHREVAIKQKRDRDDTMDLGPILEIIFGSVALREVAKGIQVWLAKRQDATLVIGKDGVKATGLRGKDALALAEIILKYQKH